MNLCPKVNSIDASREIFVLNLLSVTELRFPISRWNIWHLRCFLLAIYSFSYIFDNTFVSFAVAFSYTVLSAAFFCKGQSDHTRGFSIVQSHFVSLILSSFPLIRVDTTFSCIYTLSASFKTLSLYYQTSQSSIFLLLMPLLPLFTQNLELYIKNCKSLTW